MHGLLTYWKSYSKRRKKNTESAKEKGFFFKIKKWIDFEF